MILFDVPVAHNHQRDRLRRYLRDRAFGCLQRSVWITPHPVSQETESLRSLRANVKSLVFLEGKQCSGESDSDIVTTAWDFAAINQRYEQHLEILKEKPISCIKTLSDAAKLARWAEAERTRWNDAVRRDPLLPRELLPSDYLGQRALRKRIVVLRRARDTLDTFKI